MGPVFVPNLYLNVQADCTKSRRCMKESLTEPSAAAPQALHITSLIVHVQPSALDDFKRWVDGVTALEIHLSNADGKLVVVLETSDHFQIGEMMETIKDQHGVLNAVMVYHEELAVSEIDDEMVEKVADSDSEQPVKIVGEL